MAAGKVMLTGHAVDGPPVIRIPSGYQALDRISTSFNYQDRIVPRTRHPGHNIMG